MLIIRAVDRWVTGLVATGAWTKLQVRWYLCSAVQYWCVGAPLYRKKTTTQGKMTLFFQQKRKSAAFICLYKYKPPASSFPPQKGTFSSHPFISFSHNLSTYEHLHISSMIGLSLPWGRRFPFAPLGKQCVFSKWALFCHRPLLMIEMSFEYLLSISKLGWRHRYCWWCVVQNS